MNRLIYIIILFFILPSCDLDMRLTSLYKQRIYDSDKVLYKYTYHGKYDTSRGGTVLLDSTKDFSSKRKYRIETGLITKIDSNNVIESIDTSLDKNSDIENDSIKTERSFYDALIVNISYFKIKSRLQKNRFYNFEWIKESKHQVTFYGVEYESGKLTEPDSMTFPKGGIYIHDTDGIIDYFKLYSLVREKKDKSDILEYGRIDYTFYPKDTLYVNELSDYGFFKRIKETRFTTALINCIETQLIRAVVAHTIDIKKDNPI